MACNARLGAAATRSASPARSGPFQGIRAPTCCDGRAAVLPSSGSPQENSQSSSLLRPTIAVTMPRAMTQRWR